MKMMVFLMGSFGACMTAEAISGHFEMNTLHSYLLIFGLCWIVVSILAAVTNENF